jgi:hypothetical protein
MAKKSIKLRAKAKGGEVSVKALISHPMETGLRKDKKTGKKIPAHFIQEVTVKANGTRLISFRKLLLKPMAKTYSWRNGVRQFPKTLICLLNMPVLQATK